MFASLRTCPNEAGGHYGEAMARWLAGRGHEVTVLVKRTVERPLSDGVRVLACVQGRGGWRTPFIRWARRQLAEGDYDLSVSLSTEVPATVMLPYGGLVCAQRNTEGESRLQRSMGYVDLRRRRSLKREVQTLEDLHVKRFIAVSLCIRRQLTDAGVEADRIVTTSAVWPGCFERGNRRNAAGKRAAVRKALGIGSNQVVYACVGHTEVGHFDAGIVRVPCRYLDGDRRRQGIDTLVEALASLVGRGVDAVLVLGGAPTYLDLKTAARLGVRDRLRVLGLMGDMDDLWAIADVAVQPSRFDAAGYSVMRALLTGVPVVTTRHNGASELVAGGDGSPAGRVIDSPDDPEALVWAMNELSEPTLQSRCADAAATLAGTWQQRGRADAEALEAVLTEAAEAANKPSVADLQSRGDLA